MMKKRFQVSLLTLCVIFACSDSHAGFMEDFYAASNTQGNVTAAGLYESANLKVASAGGFVYRSPRVDFTPFYFTPPKLSAGCGGIDLFMGAFSIPSKEEFVNYLKAIGSALPGLAFQLALQTLSPDLSEQVTSFRDLIREYSARFQDSCTAAQTLLDLSGAKGYMEKLKYSASNSLRDRGIVSDAYEADSKTRAHGSTVFDYSPTQRDAGGNVVEAPEMNLTWALLGGGTVTANYPKVMKELMMTLVGTTIYVKVGDGADAVAQSRLIMGEDIAMALFGAPESALLTDAYRLSCDATDTLCLTPKRVLMDDINLTNTMWLAAKRYQRSLRERNPALVTDDDILLLGSVTSIPLISLINTVTRERLMGFGDDILRVYVEAAAFEAIVRALEQLSVDMQKAISASSAASVNTINEAHAERILHRLVELRGDLATRADKIYQQMTRTMSFIDQVNHIEKALLGNTAHEIAALWRLKP